MKKTFTRFETDPTAGMVPSNFISPDDLTEPIEKMFLIYICSAILTKSGRKPIDEYNFTTMKDRTTV